MDFVSATGSIEGQCSAVVDTSAACRADGLEPVGDDLESPAPRAVLAFPGVRIWSRPSMQAGPPFAMYLRRSHVLAPEDHVVELGLLPRSLGAVRMVVTCVPVPAAPFGRPPIGREWNTNAPHRMLTIGP
jgi:hypothetical protein